VLVAAHRAALIRALDPILICGVNRITMRKIRFVHLLMLLALFPYPVFSRADRHKSEAEIAKMTPDQRVQEYCDEYYHHAFWDSDYIDMIDNYILQDGTKVLPAITRTINEFDPTTSKGKSRQKDARAFAAEGLLSQVDGRIIRLRAIPEGRAAIDALKSLVQRMLAVHFDKADVMQGETSDRYRYEASQSELKDMQGINHLDRGIKDTLRIRYKITLSDGQTLDLINYLISQEPRYPSWSTLENYKDLSDRNEAGNPRQYLVLKNPEPFYKLYLKFKGAP
jgi:hypothetical protein